MITREEKECGCVINWEPRDDQGYDVSIAMCKEHADLAFKNVHHPFINSPAVSVASLPPGFDPLDYLEQNK